MERFELGLIRAICLFFLTVGSFSSLADTDVKIPKDLKDIVLVTDFDYTLVGDAMWTPMLLFLKEMQHDPMPFDVGALPRVIPVTEREYNILKRYIGSQKFAKPSGEVTLIQDPVGALRAAPMEIEIGKYFVDPVKSFPYFRDEEAAFDGLAGAYNLQTDRRNHLLSDFQIAENRAQNSDFKIEGMTWDLFFKLTNSGLSQNAVIITARGQQNDFSALFSYWRENNYMAAEAADPHVFALSHPTQVVHHRDSLAHRKLSVLRSAIAEYDAQAASEGVKKVMVVADDKPEYVQIMGDELMSMSQVVTYKNLEFILVNTGTEEQRDGSAYPHKVGVFRGGIYTALPDNFLNQVVQKTKNETPAAANLKKKVKKRPAKLQKNKAAKKGALQCKTLL